MRLLTRAAYVALFLASLAIAHGDDESMDMDMNTGMSMDMHATTSAAAPTASVSQDAHSEGPMSYFAYGKHSSTVLAHIALMILGWCFVLPAGKRRSILIKYSNRD